MSLTTAQLATLKAAIAAETDAAFVTAREQGATGEMAAFYNQAAVPTFYVWRSNYTPQDIAKAIDNGITQLDGLTASKRDSLLWWAERQHDMTLAQSQAAVDDLCGSQNTLKAAVKDGGKRMLLRGERLFATGTGSLAAPGTTQFEGTIRNEDIVLALSA
jgi:hypothetical protein